MDACVSSALPDVELKLLLPCHELIVEPKTTAS